MVRRCKCGCKTELMSAAKCSDYFEKKGYVNVSHMALHGLAKSAKKKQQDQKSKNISFKKEFQKSDVKTRKAAAKEWCHRYIRIRDQGRPCICCGRPLGEKYDAGHFLESGNNSILRYHEDNIHAQSVYCNQYKGGNSDDYEGRLRIKIGDERVDYLLANKGGPIKRTADDYKEIEDYYRVKIKELA